MEVDRKPHHQPSKKLSSRSRDFTTACTTARKVPRRKDTVRRPATAKASLTSAKASDITPPASKYISSTLVCNPIWEFDPFIYRYNETTNEGTSLIFQDVCASRGWKKYGPNEEKMVGGSATSWNLWWRFTQSSINPNKSLYSWQFTNHIPKAIGFCNKSYMANYLNGLRNTYGDIYNLTPTTFILPQQYEQLVQEHQHRSKLDFSKHQTISWPYHNLVPKTTDGDGERLNTEKSCSKSYDPVWIIKPVGKSQGKGIFVVNSLEGLDFMIDNHDGSYNVLANVVVQEYIARPLLIAGFKFDLRLYVCVTSVSPLTVYLYREGLTRFATEKYNVEDLGNCFSHLTNASLNKTGPGYSEDKERVGKGCKWSLSHLRAYLKETGHSDWYLWQRIVSIILLSLIGESHKWISLPYTRNCFEFLGYDILIDENLRPWLLEVNLSPGLNSDCQVDYEVKKPMLNDLFNLIGLPDERSPRQKKATKVTLRDFEQITTPPKYMPTPLSHINPATIDRALDMVKPKNRKKFENNSILKRRLVDMTAIYTKTVVPESLKPQPKKGTGKKGKPNDNNERCSTAGKSDSFVRETLIGDVFGKHPELQFIISSKAAQDKTSGDKQKPVNGLTFRTWIDPVPKCGDWVRIFPFDRISHSMSRGKFRPLNVSELSAHIESYVTTARLIKQNLRGKNMSDRELNRVLQEVNELTSDVWLPRCAAELPKSAEAFDFGPDSSLETTNIDMSVLPPLEIEDTIPNDEDVTTIESPKVDQKLETPTTGAHLPDLLKEEEDKLNNNEVPESSKSLEESPTSADCDSDPILASPEPFICTPEICDSIREDSVNNNAEEFPEISTPTTSCDPIPTAFELPPPLQLKQEHFPKCYLPLL